MAWKVLITHRASASSGSQVSISIEIGAVVQHASATANAGITVVSDEDHNERLEFTGRLIDTADATSTGGNGLGEGVIGRAHGATGTSRMSVHQLVSLFRAGHISATDFLMVADFSAVSRSVH